MEPKALANLNGTLVPSGSGSSTTTVTNSTTKITTTTTTTTTNSFSSSTTTRPSQQPTTPGNTTSTGRSKRRSSSLWVRTPPSPDASSSSPNGGDNRRVSDSILAMSTSINTQPHQTQAGEEEEEEEREWTTLSPIPKTPAPEHVARLAANLSPASSTVTDFADLNNMGVDGMDDGGGFLIPADEAGHIETDFLRDAMPEHHGHTHGHGHNSTSLAERGAMTCPPKPSLSYAVPSVPAPPQSRGRSLFSMSVGSAGLPSVDEMDIDTTTTNNHNGEGSSNSMSGPPAMVSSTMAGTYGLLRDNRERNLGVMMRLNAARRKSLQFAPKVGSPLARSWTGRNGNNNNNNGGRGAGVGGGGGGGVGGGTTGAGTAQ